MGKKKRSHKKSTNWFYETVDGLVNGKISALHLRLAYKEFVRQRTDIPDGIKELALQQIDRHFLTLGLAIGALELTARRFEYAGRKDAKKEMKDAKEK